MSKLKTAKNYREVLPDCCGNCLYLIETGTTNVYGFYTYKCERGKPKRWENIEVHQYVCDGHKREVDNE